MLEIKDVNVHIDYKTPFERQIISNFNLYIKDTEKLLLIAPSGSGKTTIANLISGIVKATTGTIEIDGKNIKKNKNPLKDVGYLIQNSSKQITCNNLYNEFNLGYKRLYKKKLTTSEINFWMKKFDFQKELSDNPLNFSEGEKKIVSLINFLLCKYKLIILDEPFTFLDPKIKKKVIDILKEFKISIILITHDINGIYSIFDNVLYYDEKFKKFSKVKINKFLEINKKLKIVDTPDKIILENYVK